MEKIKSRLIILMLANGLASFVPIKAQNLSLDFVYGGVEDAEKLLEAYLEPFANILGSDLNAGWYNTARPHKLGGLDIMATVSVARAPSSLLSFDVSAMDLNGVLAQGSPNTAPTISGSIGDRPVLEYSQDVEVNGNTETIPLASYTLPNGSGVDFFPLPMGQLTVGLPLGTDVSARFVPMIQLGDFGEIGLWGVGGKHSISQWLPGVKSLKFLDIAVQGGYTKVNSSVLVDVEPLPGLQAPAMVPDWHNQYVKMQVEGWTVNLISSQTISVLTVYEGIGYASSLVEVQMEGDYPIPAVVIQGTEAIPAYEVIKDPVNMSFENMENLRLNIGLRIKLAVFTLHYDYTKTLYSTHTVGIGVSFR